MDTVTQVQNACYSCFMTLKLEFRGPAFSIPENNGATPMITARSQEPPALKGNHG